MTQFIESQKITNTMPLSENKEVTAVDYTYIKKTVDGWNVCATTGTGTQQIHYHAFPTKERATKFADKVLLKKKINLAYWRELSRYE